MIGKMKTCTLLSGHRKIQEQLQKGLVKTLVGHSKMHLVVTSILMVDKILGIIIVTAYCQPIIDVCC